MEGLCRSNAESLERAIDFCAAHGIGSFRVNSEILPRCTHPDVGYRLDELPAGEDVVERFRSVGSRARRLGVRLGFHPDQFVVLSSPNPKVVESSLRELEYQAEVAEWIGADFINIHGGGAYGDKESALARLRSALRRLPDRIRSRITIENDDTTYSPRDLLPVCETEGIPFVYDVHHHRCLSDGATVEEVTTRALATWDREPLFHVSSPREGWSAPRPGRHHDYVHVRDLPVLWEELDTTVTVEVEAKGKELAVARLREGLDRRRRRRSSCRPDRSHRAEPGPLPRLRKVT